MPDLVVVVPTRGRPGQAAGLARALERTCTADTWMIAAVDADDPQLRTYDSALRYLPKALVHAVSQPAGHVRAINAGAREALRVFGIRPAAIAKLDDDHLPLTVGWDAMMLAALDVLGEGIVYGDDLLQSERLPTAPAISTGIVQTLGWMGPAALQHMYVDNFWLDLGRDAGCLRYLPDVVVEHRHPFAGKAAVDDGYRRVNTSEQYERDGAAYQAWLADPLGHAAAVAKVRALRSIR